MSKNGNNISQLPYFNEELKDAQEKMYSQWFDTMDTFFGTVNQFADATQKAFTMAQETHNESIKYFIPNPNNFYFKPDTEVIPKPQTQHTGHTAIVTGGVGGIGTAICERLYDDGNQVIATYIKPEEERAKQWQQEFAEKGYLFEIVELDVTDFDMCKKVARKMNKDFGHIDILVNCAGITQDATLRKMETTQWHRVIETNLDSVFNVTKSFLDNMLKRKYGRIINISSVNGQKGQFGQTNYSAAKAGMIGFSRSLAIELAETGITVNTVCPGYVGTSMVEAIPKEILDGIIAQIPVGRLAKPSEVADTVSFLSSKTSAYITGSEISVNGGLYTG